MKIVGLKVENIKKLKAVEIHPEGPVIKLTGANEQGKSSILDSITMALGGTKMIPEEPIRKGQSSASTRVDLGDFVVTRQFTMGSDSLVVKNKDGAKYPSPQSMLDSFIGRLSFDPLEFIQTTSKKQVETLLQVVNIPVDYEYLRKISGYEVKKQDNPIDAVNDSIALVKLNRTEINKYLTRDKKVLESYGSPTKTEAVVIKDLFLEKEEITKQLQIIKSRKDALSALGRELEDAKFGFDSCEEEIKQLEKKLIALRNESEKRAKCVQNLMIQFDAEKSVIATLEIPSYEVIDAKIANADKVNEAARRYQEYTQLKEKVETTNEEYKLLGDTVKDLEVYKEKLLSETKFPIEGLGFADGLVTYKDLPLSQASSAEKLSIGMAIAMALNPQLRVILIRDASLLDKKHLAILEQMAADNDFQIWMEIVDESGEIGIYIEDGSIVTKEVKSE